MDEMFENLPFWDLLSEEERKTVKDFSVINHYAGDSTLYGNGINGDSCLGMIYVVSGELRAYILSEEGREITLFRLCEGDSCVLSASCVISQIDFETVLSTMTDAEVLVIPSAVFGKLTQENVHVKNYAYEMTTERFSTVMWVMQQILFRRFDQRLAAFLLNEHHRTGATELRMTQEQIAQQVNSAREVVARMLKQFALEGLVENRRGIIVLKDIKGLEAIQ